MMGLAQRVESDLQHKFKPDGYEPLNESGARRGAGVPTSALHHAASVSASRIS